MDTISSALGAYNVVVVFILSVIGTIVIAVSTFSKLRDKKNADLFEATTTWRQLAEARLAEISDLKHKLQALRNENYQLSFRNERLWEQIQKANIGELSD